MDWVLWHDRYETAPSLRERLGAVRNQLRAAIDSSSAEPCQLLSVCSGDGRDVIGVLASSDTRKPVRAHLVDSNPEVVARAQEVVEHSKLSSKITFHCADATRPDTYKSIPAADVLLLSGVFGNLTDTAARELIKSVAYLANVHCRVVWTRNLGEFDDGVKAIQFIRNSFAETGFVEQKYVQTPSGIFAVATHSFEGPVKELPEHGALFKFTGFWAAANSV